ncbi:cytochrome P450 [Sanghuangporus baumii]|uniref:Cytochrome P450 n=1 Tax=Sanghuangporus baumii TaxID=108892 RepID=A0A9Q5NCS3_SANBA|nr:cytochrome P450 [Sanghuangporus baumii]
MLRLRRCRAIDDLLRKYGPIVRVAPNKVIFLDSATMKVVYGVSSKLNKSKFYKCLTTNGNDHAMTTLDHSSHLLRKRGYASHYNPANLALFQPEIHSFTRGLVDLLSAAASSSPMAIDTLLLFRHYFIDVNCMHLFDYSAGSLNAWSRNILQGGPPDELSRAISDFPKQGLLAVLVLHSSSVKRSKLSLFKFTFQRLRDARSMMRLEKMRSGNEHYDEDLRKPLIARLQDHKYNFQGSLRMNMPDEDIVSECTAHLIAGTDTTSTTLSYLLWELSRRPDIMAHLQAELDECMPDPKSMLDIQELQKLPYLTALIKEGLRVYSAAPSPLERVAPANRDAEISLLGYSIPPGTIIASQAFSSHRREDVFFCPNLFLPDRWLLQDLSASPASRSYGGSTPAESRTPEDESPPLSPSSSVVLSETEKGSPVARPNGRTRVSQVEMAKHMFPFGHGPRVCGGQNLAQIMLRVVLSAIARNFDIIAPLETNEKSMAMRDIFVAFPAALECKLIFVPRSQ